MKHSNAFISQAVKHARASDHDALISIFDRIKILFGRLEIHIELPLTVEMMDIIAQILAESLSILGIATKEIKRGRLSKYLLFKYEDND